jgi:signal peptidase I
MALRAYFIQPFKIPTGSMQPTLYGITSTTKEEPDWTDKPPANFVKWLILGEWYKDVRAKYGGHLFIDTDSESFQQVFRIGNTRYYVPRDAVAEGKLMFNPNTYVPSGAKLWSGIVRAGDHVFVDKFTWNFRKPQRGEIVVFETRGIHGLPPNTHYIKRLIALPGETVSIQPPEVMINGKKITEPRIRKIAETPPGYLLPPAHALLTDPHAMQETNNTVVVPADHYFVLGDNTKSSRDSRYWGTVPAENMVGKAFFVYWPFSKRWGIVR